VDAILVDGLHKIFFADSLTPISTSTTLEAISEPQALVCHKTNL
jgi:hypothetical protein